MNGGRFDYIKYDEKAIDQQQYAKGLCEMLEQFALTELVDHGGTVTEALKKLEEFYMWIGKSVRNNQIGRSQIAPLQEERTDS